MYGTQQALRGRPAPMQSSSSYSNNITGSAVIPHTSSRDGRLVNGNIHRTQDNVQTLWQLCEREVQRMAELCREHGELLHSLHAQLEQMQGNMFHTAAASTSGLMSRNSAEASRLVQGVTQLRILQLKLNSAHAIMSSTITRVAQQAAMFAESIASANGIPQREDEATDGNVAMLQTQLKPQLSKLDTVMRDFLAKLNNAAADLSLPQLRQDMQRLLDEDSALRRGVKALAEAVHDKATGTIPINRQPSTLHMTGNNGNNRIRGDGEDRQRTLDEIESTGHETSREASMVPDIPLRTQDSSRLSTVTITGQPIALANESTRYTPLYPTQAGTTAGVVQERLRTSERGTYDHTIRSNNTITTGIAQSNALYDTQTQSASTLPLDTSAALQQQQSRLLQRPSPALTTTDNGGNVTTAVNGWQQQQPSQLLLVSAVQQVVVDVVLPRLQSWLNEHMSSLTANSTQSLQAMQNELRQLVEAQHELLRGVLTSINQTTTTPTITSNSNEGQMSSMQRQALQQPQEEINNVQVNTSVQGRVEQQQQHMDVRARHWQRVAQELQQDLLATRTAMRNEGRRYARLEEANLRLRERLLSLQATQRKGETEHKAKSSHKTPSRHYTPHEVRNRRQHRQTQDDDYEDTVARSLNSSLGEEEEEEDTDDSFYTVSPQSRIRPTVRLTSRHAASQQQRPHYVSPQTATRARQRSEPVPKGQARGHSVTSNATEDISISPLSEEEEEVVDNGNVARRQSNSSTAPFQQPPRSGSKSQGQRYRAEPAGRLSLQPSRPAHNNTASVTDTSARDYVKDELPYESTAMQAEDDATEREVRRAVDDARSLLQRLKASSMPTPREATRRISPRHTYNTQQEGDEEDMGYEPYSYSTRHARKEPQRETTAAPPLLPPYIKRRERHTVTYEDETQGTPRTQLAALAQRRSQLLQELDALHTQQDKIQTSPMNTNAAHRRQGNMKTRDSVTYAQERQRLLAAVHKMDAAMATLQSRIQQQSRK